MKQLLRLPRLLFVFFCVFALSDIDLKADHLIGGDLTYRYIGDSTGRPRHYLVRLVLHRSTRFQPLITSLPATYNLCVRSSCHANTTIAVNLIGGLTTTGQLVPGQDECVESTDGNYTEVYEHIYEGVIELPGACADWVFSYATVCCRLVIANITNYSGLAPGVNNTNYFEATLNNTQGENTSPQFLTAPAKSFCTNNFFTWSQASFEPDNDSIQYSMGTAQNGVCNGPGINLVFAPPYTEQVPLDIAPGTNMTLNNNGVLEFTTSAVQGNFIVVIEIEEFRMHSSGSFWIRVGSVRREMLVNVVNTCRQAVGNGPQIDLSRAGFYMDDVSTSARGVIGNDYPIPNDSTSFIPSENDSFFYWPVVVYDCFDTVITLHFDMNVQCPSIAPDGTDFRLVGPDSLLRPIVAATPECNVALETQTVHLKLHRPLAIDGDYFLYAKKGTDNNTILNACGFPLDEFFTMVIRVENCPNPIYDIENVTVIENNHIGVNWSFDSIPASVVEGWYFYRSDDDGATYARAGSIVNENAGDRNMWIDFNITHPNVNSQSYRYKMQMQMGGELFDTTRNINSIFLQQNDLSRGVWDLVWNPYNGWPNPEYTLMQWNIAPDTWNPVAMGGNPTVATNLTYNLPEEDGDYAIRIDARDPANQDTAYISESNYIYFTMDDETLPPEDLLIPNVFTPNNDGNNDTYFIQGLEGYRKAHIVITNRWGNKVFESENYQNDEPWGGVDQKSGAKLPDGVYFYILRLYGGIDGEDVRTGQLTIFGS